ncbi:class I SAM-dependent methyltransferase [Aquimarina sp. MMG016]|uniref:class I SAM-dependent methyltransferase n=1 Tax=Aquimarina sp. MMG016 TaxID=2822690 RepID=UPI001B3A3CF2|nr:class I SAM-dependent methyltransferase [Aquimarina sp. MMG016]MBQ4820049.1 class I SAM-dependent methyltransferase [Aquimarina sp. MMG016]
MENKKNLNLFIECKDHTVSGETFQLFHDSDLDMLITSPKPKEEDLGRYYESEDYISHTDAKRSLFEKLYHTVKVYSLQKKVKLISKLHNSAGNLLDIGAGTGDFLVAAQKKGWNVSGTEPNDQARKLAEAKEVNMNQDITDLEINSFDVITMWHVLEHVSNLEDQIIELKKLLKPNGYLIIAVPNFKSFDAKYYKSFWAAYDVPRHLWHFSKTSIRKLFSKHDLKLEKTLPMKFDSYYVSLLSEKYKNGKMNFFNAFRIGFLSNAKAKRSKEYSSHIYILKNS